MEEKQQGNLFYPYLYRIAVKTIVPKQRKLIALNSSLTVQEATKVLNIKKILSSPIFSSEYTCVGSVDVLDVVSFLLQKKQDMSKARVVGIP